MTELPAIAGSTPLSDEEKLGLIPTHIATVGQLNLWEHKNIQEAERWAFGRKRKDVISEKFIRTLHRHMFEDTWEWAGKYRESNKNPGVAAYLIPTSLRQAIDDMSYWREQKSFRNREIAVRFHHRVVQVHPFPNGNGRHARLLADVYLFQTDEPAITWGGSDSLRTVGDAERLAYLDALKQADLQNYAPLLEVCG